MKQFSADQGVTVNFSVAAIMCFVLTSASCAAIVGIWSKGLLKKVTRTAGGLAVAQSLVGIVIAVSSFLLMVRF